MTDTDILMLAYSALDDALKGIREGRDPKAILARIAAAREELRRQLGLPDDSKLAPIDRHKVLARRIQRALEQMPYPWVMGVETFTAFAEDDGKLKVHTLRSFFENTWQGPHADEVFRQAGLVAADAVLGKRS